MRADYRGTLVLLVLTLLALPWGACGGGADGADNAATGTEAGTEAGAPATGDPAGDAATADAGAVAGDPAEAARAYGDLPANFRGLVRAEMTHLEPSMQRLLSFIARGDARMGALTARQIEETFVLKRSLPEDQRRAIVEQLPAPFLELDRAFHRNAGEVARALDAGDFRHASDLYGEMTQLCVSCHGRYALARFPRLAGVPAAEAAAAAEDAGASEAATPGATPQADAAPVSAP